MKTINNVSIIGMGALGLLYGKLIADARGRDAVRYIVDDERFEKYKDIIREYSKDVFYENGIFVATCDYCNKTVSISFSESPACSKYIEKAMRENHLNDLSPIQAIVELEWLDKYSNIIKIFQMPLSISMQHPSACKINGVPLIKDAVHLGIKVYFEGQLMSYVIRSLQDTEVLD